jgi:hypothetical protein
MGNLGEILQKKIRQMGAERQVEAAGVVEAAQKEIAKYIPEEDFEVVSFNRGTLKVKVKNSVVASELNLNCNSIKKIIQIKSIKIEIS